MAGRLADVLGRAAASFVFSTRRAGRKTLVDIAVGAGRGERRGGRARGGGGARAAHLLARARGEAAAAVFDPRASGSGSLRARRRAPGRTPLAAALDLLTKVATGTAAAARGPPPPYRNDVGDWGPVARLGAPATMWDSVGANGGRAVDLMYGVMLSGGMDPNRAALPACLVSDSADN